MEPAPRLVSCLSVPLVEGHTLVAVLTMYAAERSLLTDDLGWLVQMVAPHIAAALHTARARAAAAAGGAGARPRSAARRSGRAHVDVVDLALVDRVQGQPCTSTRTQQGPEAENAFGPLIRTNFLLEEPGELT
jgi:GAF domain-containing protein